MTHYQNPFLPHSQRGSTPAPAPKRVAQTIEVDGIPVGTTVQILDWVGDDADRARLALDRERMQDRPRVKLVTELTTVIRRDERAVFDEAAPVG